MADKLDAHIDTLFPPRHQIAEPRVFEDDNFEYRATTQEVRTLLEHEDFVKEMRKLGWVVHEAESHPSGGVKTIYLKKSLR